MNIKNLRIINKRLLSFILAFNCMFFPISKGKAERTKLYSQTNLFVHYGDDENVEYKRYNSKTKEKHNISIFDEENIESMQYGANQRDFEYNFDDLINNPLIWEEMQNYFPEEMFESHEEAMFFYKKYFELIADSGCGYVAACNYVFHMFEGREDEFEEYFGYPMYTVNKKGYVDFNYEVFILKFFNFSILKKRGLHHEVWNTMAKDINKFRLDNFLNSDEYLRKKPNNYFELTEKEQEEWDRVEQEGNQKFHELFNNWLNSSNSYYNFGISIDANFGYLYVFLAEHGIVIDSKVVYETKEYVVDDIIASDSFDLYNEEETLSDVDSHYIYVTEVDNKTITVSSWGRKYVFDNSNANLTKKILLKLKH